MSCLPTILKDSPLGKEMGLKENARYDSFRELSKAVMRFQEKKATSGIDGLLMQYNIRRDGTFPLNYNAQILGPLRRLGYDLKLETYGRYYYVVNSKGSHYKPAFKENGTLYSLPNEVKPEVSELFESNPELANEVYQALEYEQDVDILENNGELAYNEYTKDIHESSEKLTLKEAIQRAVDNTNNSYLKILGNCLLSNDKFLKNRYAYIATDTNKFTSALGKNGQGFNGFILSINNPRIIIHEAIHTFTGSIIDVNINEKDSLNKFELEFKNKIRELYEIAKSEIDNEYGITNEDEFLAEISNTTFINKLKNIPYKESNILNEFIETIKNLFKNLFLKTFSINSDIQQKDDEYFIELKFNNGNTQNQYFKTKEEAKSFIETINGSISLDNVAGQLVNEFLKVIEYRGSKITPQQKQQAQKLYSQYLESLNKLNTNPILQGNQQEQIKKFVELQERLNNKEFIEGAKFAYESTSALQQYGTQEQYNDYIARVSLGITKNPSSGEYNYTSKVKNIVYHGTREKFDNFDLDKKGLSGRNYGKAIYLTPKKGKAERYAIGKYVMGVIINIQKPLITSLRYEDFYKIRSIKDDEKFSDFINNDSILIYDWLNRDLLKIKNKNFIEYFGKTDTDGFPISYSEGDIYQYMPELSEIVVKNNEQTHILGGKQDVEGFKEFVNSGQESDVEAKVKELEREGLLEIDCSKVKAKNGIRSQFTKGSQWEIVKDLKGHPSHSQGGVDVKIGKNGFSFTRGNSIIEAKYGLVLPKTK